MARSFFRTFCALVCILLCVSLAAGCSQTTASPDEETDSASDTAEESAEVSPPESASAGSPSGSSAGQDADSNVVVLEMEDGADIVVELDPDAAPKTVENFKELVSEGFYDGLTFHRVSEGFVIQGGDPEGTGTGGPGYTIEGEFASNGYDNPLTHVRGVISMARAQDPNSAGSQFFIVLEDAPHLDGQYAAFGAVISGMDEVDKIAATATDAFEKPLEDIVISRAYIANPEEAASFEAAAE